MTRAFVFIKRDINLLNNNANIYNNHLFLKIKTLHFIYLIYCPLQNYIDFSNIYYVIAHTLKMDRNNYER